MKRNAPHDRLNDTNSEEAKMPVTSQRSALKYTELPERARKAIDGFIPDEARIAARIEQFRNVKPRPADKEGDAEILNGVKFTHHFVEAPGDDEWVSWHYVTSNVVKANRLSSSTVSQTLGSNGITRWLLYRRRIAASRST
jgi:hypothetical protein